MTDGCDSAATGRSVLLLRREPKKTSVGDKHVATRIGELSEHENETGRTSIEIRDVERQEKERKGRGNETR